MAKSRLWRKVRLLTQILIFSGTLNIALLATFVYVSFGDRSQSAAELKREQSGQVFVMESRSIEQLFEELRPLSFDELKVKLSEKVLVEEGFYKRDLALSLLVDRYHFNLERALGGQLFEKRRWRLAEQEELLLFPALSDQSFEEIEHFIDTEQWPFTAQGLFRLIKSGEFKEPSLLETFFMSSEFFTVETLFSRGEIQVSREELLALLMEGEWENFSAFVKLQKEYGDFPDELRHAFLLDYLALDGDIAPQLILKTDFKFALSRLTDEQVLRLFASLEESTESRSLQFALEILKSHRSLAVLQRSAELLYAWSGERLELPYHHQAALERFGPGASSVVVEQEGSEESFRKPYQQYHVVQEGDSLWKIAKLYQTDIQTLKERNSLTSDVLRRGNILEIPVE